MPYYRGVLQAKLRAELEADKRRAEDAAGEANAAAAMRELEAEGWIERG